VKIELIAAVPENHRQGLGERTYRMLALTLPYLAALVPPDIEIHLTDELVRSVDPELEADLVGITFMTLFSKRGYELADHFRKRGITVVLGGPHVTLLPQEAKNHADAVVIGEAEETWPSLIKDFQHGMVQPFYNGSPPSLSNLVIPRRDLLNRKDYAIFDTVLATRGCPHKCNFCCIPLIFPKRIRTRPVQEVVEEVATLKSKIIFIWDDNIIADRYYAKELFLKLTPLKKIWASQCTLSIAENEELLKLAYKSGCRGLFVGLESFSKICLDEANKSFNKINTYRDAIHRFHDNGISVQVGIMFGFDHDDSSVFERTVELVTKLKVDSIGPSILTPLPNTPLFHRLQSEGRLLHTDWSKYDGAQTVYRPMNMSVDELNNGYHWAQHHFYSFKNITYRILGSRTNIIFNAIMNIKYKRALARVFPKGSVRSENSIKHMNSE
jgi:radical SAM superfamily enzyme YgiQ (UPF0313 family)